MSAEDAVIEALRYRATWGGDQPVTWRELLQVFLDAKEDDQ